MNVFKPHEMFDFVFCISAVQHLCSGPMYAVSQKNIPNIFDCNLKNYSHIIIIFGTDIPETTCH